MFDLRLLYFDDTTSAASETHSNIKYNAKRALSNTLDVRGGNKDLSTSWQRLVAAVLAHAAGEGAPREDLIRAKLVGGLLQLQPSAKLPGWLFWGQAPLCSAALLAPYVLDSLLQPAWQAS